MIKYLFIVLFLAGCSTKPVVHIQPTKPIRIDSAVLQPCPELVEAITEEDLPFAILKNVELYAICKNRQDTSIRIIKELTNNE